MNNKTITQGFILLAAAMLLLTACGPKETDASTVTDPTQPPPADATVQVETTIVINKNITLDPAKTEDSDSLLVSRNLYEGLVTLGADGTIQPGIAFSWVISDDELDYIFELRSDAAFSDGSLITVEVIEQNFNRWFEPQNPLHGDGNYPTWLKLFLAFNGERDANNRQKSQVDGVQIVDNNTFIVHLNRPEPELLTYLTEPAFTILSSASLNNPAYGTREGTIISSGQYVITDWTDEGMTLSPNPQYWKSVEDGDLKYIFK